MSNENITVARRLKDGTLVRVMPDGTTQPFPDEEMDWAAFDALTEEDIQAAALSDPDCPPLSEERAKKFKRVYTTRFMRRALGLTQEEFSAKFRIPLGTLRDWDQGKSVPDQAARAYLTVIAKNPTAVEEALKGMVGQ